MPPVKIFFMINSLTMGGAERQMATLVSRLPRDRFEPVLCCLGPENAYRHLLPPDQPRYVVEGAGRLSAVLRVREWLARERPQIIHSFMEWSNLVARLAAPAAGDPVVITSVRSRMMRPDYALIEGLLSRRSDAVVTNSVGTLQELAWVQRVPRAKLLVINNIVDFGKFDAVSEGERAEARRKLALSGRVLLLPGRISISKNQLGAILAVALLRRKGTFPDDACLIFAGRIYNGSIKYLMSGLAKASGTKPFVKYLGPVSDVRGLYAACDWVVLPSLYEGLPNVALEAHACGRPLLVSRAANLDGIVEDGVTGFEFPTANIGSLAAAMEKALATSPRVTSEMGAAGRRRVLERFDPGAALEAVMSLYEELLRKKRIVSPA